MTGTVLVHSAQSDEQLRELLDGFIEYSVPILKKMGESKGFV